LGHELLQNVTLLIPMLLSLSVHEYAHAWAAARLGDDTAVRAGRFTLNPVSHIDLLGTILAPLLSLPFGWAKPVPVDPTRFRRDVTMSRGMILTASAGPISNVLLAIACSILYGVLARVAPDLLRAGAGLRALPARLAARPRRLPSPLLRRDPLRRPDHRRARGLRAPAARSADPRDRHLRPVSPMSEPRPIVVSGMRPTGRLHLGHLHGALSNWVRLQEENQCFFFSADWHALTTNYHQTDVLKQSERDMFVDFVAAGIDPEKSTLFMQSQVKEHAELYLLLGMITPIGWLERSPSYKEMRENITDRDLALYGFLGYPVLMTADIILYKATRVPVGADQVSHLELCREIVRKFNFHYGDVFPEPKPLLTEAAKVLGTDGRKMSKSYGNAIDLGEAVDSTTRKIMGAVTDPQRKRRQDPGNPDVCGIFYLHKVYSAAETIGWVDQNCRTAGIGCVDCKKKLLERLGPEQEKMRERRERLVARPQELEELVQLGNAKARAVAQRTMEQVRAAMKL
jgi:tryptophanyl-tRNA synthetase